jgi:hypothetical protein
MGLHSLLRDSFILYKHMMFVPHRKHAYGPPRPVTVLALRFHKYMMLVLHREHTHGPSQPVTGTALFFICR